MVEILIYLSLAIIGIGLLVMLVFGLKNLFTTKQSKVSIAVGFILPIVVFGIAWMIYDDAAVAGVMTAVWLLAIGFLGLLFSSVRGLLGI